MPPFKPQRRNVSVPKAGGDEGNTLERLMYAQAKGMMDSQQGQKQRGNIAQDIETVKEQFGGNIPPGTNLSVGGVTAPLNRELTESEMGPVAASQVYPNEIRGIKDLIKGGVLNSEKGKGLFNTGMEGNLDRTVRQKAAQSSSPLMTFYDPQLQKLQSKLAKAKELMFERGGKALTPAEISIVGQAFVLEGKSDDQILTDIDAADQIIEAKLNLVLGGANAAQSMTANPQQQEMGGQQDDREAKIQAIRERFKKRRP